MRANHKVVDGWEAIKMLQAQRNKALLRESKKKDNVHVKPDVAFLIGLFSFDALVLVIALLAAKVWGWW